MLDLLKDSLGITSVFLAIVIACFKIKEDIALIKKKRSFSLTTF